MSTRFMTDTPSEISLDVFVGPLDETGIGADGVVLIATPTSDCAAFANVAWAAWERSLPVVVVRVTGPEGDRRVRHDHPANVIVDVPAALASEFLPLLASSVSSGLRSLVHGRQLARVRWFRADPRPGVALNSVRWRVGWSENKEARLAVHVPADVVEAWQGAAAIVRFQAVHVHEGARGVYWANMLMFEDVDALVPFVIGPEALDGDDRRFAPELIEPVRPSDTARRLAELHLRHGDFALTRTVIDAVCGDGARGRVEASVVAAEFLGMLDYPRDADDAALESLIDVAGPITRALCERREPDWPEPY